MPRKIQYGQYFTTSETLQEKVYEFILNNPICILEPSVGKGHLVSYIRSKNNDPHIQFDMYEIDTQLDLVQHVKPHEVHYCDFMIHPINNRYNTIIGNPPYIRTKTGNLYIDFIRKCISLLNIGGELIFIVPSDFLKLTCASELLNYMMEHGTFTHIYHPHDERLFEKASIDVIVFRYCNDSSLEKKVLYNDEVKYIINTNGLITFTEIPLVLNVEPKDLIRDVFNVYVGMVTGKEEVYKHNTLGNIQVLNDEACVEPYIYIQQYPTTNRNVNNYLLEHKNALMARKIRKFNETNWYEWGAPRNIRIMEQYKGRPCIYIRTLTRQEKVAFLGKVGYFGGKLLMLLPKKTQSLEKIVTYLNSNDFKQNFMYSGRFKIGHRQISHSYI